MVTIKIRGQEYPALFDLQNVEELQQHYADGVEGVINALQKNDLKEIAYILWLLIREGVELDNEEHHRQNQPPTQKMIEKQLSWQDLFGEQHISQAIEAAFYEFYGKNVQSRDSMEKGTQIAMERLSGCQTSSPGSRSNS